MREWLAEPVEPEPPRIELLLKLFFGRQNELAHNRAHLERFREQQRGHLEHYEELLARLEHDAADSPDLPYWRMTLRYGLCQRRALVAWCDETLAELEHAR